MQLPSQGKSDVVYGTAYDGQKITLPDGWVPEKTLAFSSCYNTYSTYTTGGDHGRATFSGQVCYIDSNFVAHCYAKANVYVGKVSGYLQYILIKTS